MGISSACDHCVSRSRWSGTIVSFRPDGGDVQVYASGIRAPFGIAYDVVSGALVTSMNQRDDLGAMTPGDWLALVREGQNWRFPGCYGQGGSACSGAPKPLAVLDRHAAAGAVALVSGDLAGGGKGHAAVVSEWKRGVVLRVPLRLRLRLGKRAGDDVPERLQESAAAGARARPVAPGRRLGHRQDLSHRAPCNERTPRGTVRA